MNKPYYERPDWILKSIIYFCDNYTIDGKDLGKMKREAIETYRKLPPDGWGADASIRRKFPWDKSSQGFDWWDCLNFLQRGDYLDNQTARCTPWNNYEKRKIAKLPEVK